MRLPLDRAMLGEMLGDPAFYVKCPVFLHMQQTGLDCYNAYQQQFIQEDCGGCAATEVLAPAIREFVQHVRRLQEANATEGLESIKQYIGTRRPRQPTQLVIRYRDAAGKVQRLLF